MGEGHGRRNRLKGVCQAGVGADLFTAIFYFWCWKEIMGEGHGIMEEEIERGGLAGIGSDLLAPYVFTLSQRYSDAKRKEPVQQIRMQSPVPHNALD